MIETIEKERPTIASRLQYLRNKKGFSQKQVATAIGISPSTYREWEQGRNISGEPYQRLATLFGVTLSELMYGEKGLSSEIIQDLEEIKFALNTAISKVITLN